MVPSLRPLTLQNEPLQVSNTVIYQFQMAAFYEIFKTKFGNKTHYEEDKPW